MDKLFEALVDTLRDLARHRMPFLNAWLDRGFALRDWATTRLARWSRLGGERSILVVSVLATLWALYGFWGTVWQPNAPKPTHDIILKNRFSSPTAAQNIVIVDVDERSIASLSASHGRWPWSRDVLADGLQKLSDAGAQAVLFNVLLAEPDLKNADADAAMGFAAELFRPAAFPIIRLDAANDAQSQLQVQMIPGAQVEPAAKDKTLAAIVPIFPSMHDRLGIANQRPDSDGIVRKYPYIWTEPGFALPSMVARTLQSANIATASDLPNTFALNWRNKRGGYTRISYSDLFLDQLSAEEKSQLQSAVVVLSVSAPGIGQTKPTGIKPLVDDGEILATAVDDAMHATYLRMTPAWALLGLNLFSIWVFYWIFSRRTAKSPPLNRIFVILQVLLGGVTLLSASYTSYLIDLTDSMKFSLSVFAAIKLVQSLDNRWTRAKKGYRRINSKLEGSEVWIVGYLANTLKGTTELALQESLEKLVGVDRLVRIDDLLGGESFLQSSLSSARLMLICVADAQQSIAIEQWLQQSFASTPFKVKRLALNTLWNTENKTFAASLAGHAVDVLHTLYPTQALA